MISDFGDLSSLITLSDPRSTSEFDRQGYSNGMIGGSQTVRITPLPTGATDSEEQEISLLVICSFQIISDHHPSFGKIQRNGGFISP